jgi:hypothetical protein
MITMDTEADESTLSACALSTCHCQAVLANERSAFGVRCSVFGVRRSAFGVAALRRSAFRVRRSAGAIISRLSPCRCRSLIRSS